MEKSENKKEEWKQVSTIGIVKNANGKEVDFRPFTNFWVSTEGRVYNIKTKRFVPQEGRRIDRDGYRFITLINTEKKLDVRLHRLICYGWLPNPNNLQQINHISEDKSDNRVSNLEWCTARENNNYGSRIERMKETLKRNKENYIKKVVQMTLDGTIVREWANVREAGKNGFRNQCIYDCCYGKQKTHQGFRWQFV